MCITFRSLVSVAKFENIFFYLRKTNLKIIINEKQQLHQTAVISSTDNLNKIYYGRRFKN